MKAPVRLAPTLAYLARRATLSAERLQSLELVEEGIAVDPHGMLKRIEGLADSKTDFSEYGMYVNFHMLNEETAELTDFVDLLSDDLAQPSN